MRCDIILHLTIINIVFKTFGACLYKAGKYFKVYSHNKISNSSVDAAVLTTYLYSQNITKTTVIYENSNKTGMSNDTTDQKSNAEVEYNKVENKNKFVIDHDNGDISVIEKRKVIKNREFTRNNNMTYDNPLISVIDEKYDISIENCRNAKNHIKLLINEMADIWETVYYDLSNKVKCFKMHIKKLNTRDKKKYAEFYGTFNGEIKWDLCNLEIESSKLMRRHFLQGDGSTAGVLENIIFHEDDRHTPIFHQESPDQWMVIKNLLLMRDCNTGRVIVFSRVPYIPVRKDMVEALHAFGEDVVIGKIACDDDEIVVNKLSREN